MAKVKQVDVSAAVDLVTDSNIKSKITVLANYYALVTEVVKDGKVEGTILYIPGVNYKTLKKR